MQIGDIYHTTRCGDVIITQKSEKQGYWQVKFINTGNTQEFRKDAILAGNILDRTAPLLFGVGSIGNVSSKRENARYYNVWRNMIARCYNKNSPQYCSYGGKGITVCKRWLCFETFLADVPSLSGYNETDFLNGKLDLDKDILQLEHNSSRIYSPDTCQWIPESLNAKIQPSQQKQFTAISPNGEEFCSSNIAEFARQHGLDRRGISSVLHNRIKSHLNWRFHYTH